MEKNKKVKIRYDDSIMTIRQICDRLRRVEKQLEKVTAESEWISVEDRFPDNLQEVIVTFKNHFPEDYYLDIKDKPLTGVCVYYRRKWYWYSSITSDVLAEYGKYDGEEVDKDIEITHWMPLPESPKGE